MPRDRDVKRMKFQETKIQGGRGDKRRRCQEKDISRAGDVRKQRFHEQLVSRGKMSTDVKRGKVKRKK